MNRSTLSSSDVIGLVRPNIDAHTLGISSISKLLQESGYKTIIANADVTACVANISALSSILYLERWLVENGVTRLGFSYRLGPDEAQQNFGRLMHQLTDRRLLTTHGGPIRSVFFAGLPEACKRVQAEYDGQVAVFYGDESPVESLQKLNVPPERIPSSLKLVSAYDAMRMNFASTLVSSGNYLRHPPPDRSAYPEYGTRRDTVIARIEHSRRNLLPPLMRAHVGPYNSNYAYAVREFRTWLQRLSSSRFLDIASIGTSQLTQSHFGQDWDGLPNGGGVPINSSAEYRDLWEASRPMLLRTYAGTRNIPTLAKIHEESLNIAWHALSFWWFCQIDGRGPHEVRENLCEHIETLRYISTTNKPFEPNIPHHFAFRGADDVTYVVSGVLAVRTAKSHGISSLILQIMLNTPKSTWGVQDLAKARALLRLARESEDRSFRLYLQPRAGLDYFSHDLEKAKIQLAAVSALIDDIEPSNSLSPDMIHIVSYSEASHLATPDVIDESIQITLAALKEYRALRRSGQIENMTSNLDVELRTELLYRDAKRVLDAIELHIRNPYSAQGLYEIFHAGFLPVPYLWERREEFSQAVRWNSAVINGGVQIVDSCGVPVSVEERVAVAVDFCRSRNT